MDAFTNISIPDVMYNMYLCHMLLPNSYKIQTITATTVTDKSKNSDQELPQWQPHRTATSARMIQTTPSQSTHSGVDHSIFLSKKIVSSATTEIEKHFLL